MHKHLRGVTLLELMIVVVIIGVLAAIAYPSYRQYAQRAKRTEAMSSLLQIATNEERYYLNHNVYTTDMKNLGFSTSPSYTTASGSYTVKVSTADAKTFAAVATYANDDEEKAKCTTFAINAEGQRTSTGTAADCWTTTR